MGHNLFLQRVFYLYCQYYLVSGYQKLNLVITIYIFQALLEENPAKHPIIILKDVPFQHLTAILEFMYAGEVNVAHDQLPVSNLV